MTGKQNNDASVKLLGEKSDQFTDRLKVVIKRIGGVAKTARKTSVAESTVRSWRDGNSDPQRQHIIPLAIEAGVSIAWLVAGQPPMLQEELQQRLLADPSGSGQAQRPKAPLALLDVGCLTDSIMVIEEFLTERNLVLQPVKKAMLVEIIYEELQKEQEEANKEKILKLIKLAV